MVLVRTLIIAVVVVFVIIVCNHKGCDEGDHGCDDNHHYHCDGFIVMADEWKNHCFRFFVFEYVFCTVVFRSFFKLLYCKSIGCYFPLSL